MSAVPLFPAGRHFNLWLVLIYMKLFYFRRCSLLCLPLMVCPFVFGSTINFSTPSGAVVAAGPVNASATFTTSAGLLTITLRDLLVNPVSAGQLVSDVDFTLSVPLAGSTSLSSSAQQITINEDRTSTLGSTVATGWGLGSNGSGYTVCVICPAGYTLLTLPTTGPSQTIIGPGPYTKANGSIVSNRPHNPFLNQTATFTLANSSITAGTTVFNVIFSFGTAAGVNVPGVSENGSSGSANAVPEPSTAGLVGLGTIFVLVWLTKYKNPAV